MELYGLDDAKNKLQLKSALQREALEEEAKLISARTEKVLTNALIIGGALAATYFLVRQFSGSKPKRRRHSKKIKLISSPAEETSEDDEPNNMPGIVTQLGTALASQATAFLLDLAKEKLSEYLQTQKEVKS